MGVLKKFLSWSNLAIAIILIVIIAQTLNYKFYKDPAKIIASDVGNYYAYLPLTFIFDQLDYKFDAKSFPIVKQYLYSVPTETGNRINPTTMGMSIAYSPFFFMAHLYCKVFNEPATGFSQPYRIGIILASIFYTLIAVFLLLKILGKIFNNRIAALGVIALILATNLLYYLIFEPGMTHAFNFSFTVYFLYFTLKWHEKPSVVYSIATGLSIGLISLIRPTDAIVALVFILWKVKSFGILKNNVVLFINKWYLILIIIASAILVWVPQMLYWHHFTGQYLYNPYKGYGFKFFFDNPQFLISLFSYRKGWLLYTPVMLLIIPGFVVLYRKYREYFWPVLIYFIFNLWIIASWCLPWYGGSYGQRAYIASYGIMLIPLAATLSALFSKKMVLNLIAGTLIVGMFIAHNMFQLKQAHYGSLHFVGMTKEAYWDSFGRKHPSHRFPYLIAFPNYDSAKMGIYPKDVVNPLFTEEQNYDTAYNRLTRFYLKELSTDSVKIRQLMTEATDLKVTYDDLIKVKTKERLENMIKNDIVSVKK